MHDKEKQDEDKKQDINIKYESSNNKLRSDSYYRNCTWKELPDVVMIELTNACNFSCTMCPNNKSKRKKGFMDIEIFKIALDQISKDGIKKVKLYTTGESLLHPQFLEFWKLAIMDKYGFEQVMISTNASKLTEEIIKEIVKSNKLKIQISYCGWNRRSYEERYRGGNFEEVIETIKLLKKYIADANLPVETLTINGVSARKTGSIEKIKNFLKKDLGLDDKQLIIHNANNWNYVFDEKITANKYNNDNNKHRQNYGTMDQKEKVSTICEDKHYYCHIANTRIGILFDGRVTACGCLDVNGELVVGDITKETIRQIRKGKLFFEYVNKLNTGNVQDLMCARCDALKELK